MKLITCYASKYVLPIAGSAFNALLTEGGTTLINPVAPENKIASFKKLLRALM